MRFEKGRSGNPGGRPKGHGDLRELARQHTEDALATLVEICRNGENEGARIAAANALLDRGWGKPTVPVVAWDPPAVITMDFGWKPRAPAPLPPTLYDTRAPGLPQELDDAAEYISATDNLCASRGSSVTPNSTKPR
jgi:hypothetical protein